MDMKGMDGVTGVGVSLTVKKGKAEREEGVLGWDLLFELSTNSSEQAKTRISGNVWT